MNNCILCSKSTENDKFCSNYCNKLFVGLKIYQKNYSEYLLHRASKHIAITNNRNFDLPNAKFIRHNE